MLIMLRFWRVICKAVNELFDPSWKSISYFKLSNACVLKVVSYEVLRTTITSALGQKVFKVPVVLVGYLREVWPNGQRARLILQRSQFESCWSLQRKIL